MMVRDVDKIDLLPDAKIKMQDKAYLDKHELDPLFKAIMNKLLTTQPADPIQFMIDHIEYGPDAAAQDPKTGLPERRLLLLEQAFGAFDLQKLGKVSFRSLQLKTNRHGGNSLSQDELSVIFTDFKPQGQGEVYITAEEFNVFFSKISKKMSNQDFNEMCKDLIA